MVRGWRFKIMISTFPPYYQKGYAKIKIMCSRMTCHLTSQHVPTETVWRLNEINGDLFSESICLHPICG